MTTKRILYTRLDGGVTVDSIAPQLLVRLAGVRAGQEDRAAFFAGIRRAWDDQPLDATTVDRLSAMMDSDATDETVAVELCRAHVIPPTAADIRVEDGEDSVDFAGKSGIRWPDGSVLGRRFRSCYRRSGTNLPRIDMFLARGERINEVRVARMPKLEKSDIDLLRAQEKADVVMQDSLKDYRQKLRDIPTTEKPNVDAITTPEALATWEPAWPVDPA